MPNKEINYALKFHEITKHSYISVRTDRYYLDWSIKPYPFKVYIDLPKIHLPKDFPKPEKNALDCFKIPEHFSEEDIDLKKVAELLYFTAGISRVKNMVQNFTISGLLQQLELCIQRKFIFSVKILGT
jgi:hypothetical protein